MPEFDRSERLWAWRFFTGHEVECLTEYTNGDLSDGATDDAAKKIKFSSPGAIKADSTSYGGHAFKDYEPHHVCASNSHAARCLCAFLTLRSHLYTDVPNWLKET